MKTCQPGRLCTKIVENIRWNKYVPCTTQQLNKRGGSQSMTISKRNYDQISCTCVYGKCWKNLTWFRPTPSPCTFLLRTSRFSLLILIEYISYQMQIDTRFSTFDDKPTTNRRYPSLLEQLERSAEALSFSLLEGYLSAKSEVHFASQNGTVFFRPRERSVSWNLRTHGNLRMSMMSMDGGTREVVCAILWISLQSTVKKSSKCVRLTPWWERDGALLGRGFLLDWCIWP